MIIVLVRTDYVLVNRRPVLLYHHRGQRECVGFGLYQGEDGHR